MTSPGETGTAESLLLQWPGHVAIVGPDGRILAVNANWRRFAAANGLDPDAASNANYLTVCARASSDGAAHADDASAGIQDVLSGRQSEFFLDYPCHSPQEHRWYRMRVVPLRWEGIPAALVVHWETTRDAITREHLATTQEELGASRALLETAQTIAKMASVELDHGTGAVVRSTSGTVNILGLSRPPLRSDDLCESMTPASRRTFMSSLEDPDASPREIELELFDGPGTRWVCAVRGSGSAGQEGANSSAIVFQDITAIKAARDEVLRLNASLERRVQRRTRQLEAANRELEAFSYSVSHDLKAPLAAIDGFTHVLAEKLKGRLDEKEQGYLERVRTGVVSMFALIDAMLTLHRLSHETQLECRTVDLSDIAASIIRELREQDPGRRCEVRIEPRIVAYCDADLMTIALRNLIGNSWKFSAHADVTRIEFTEQDPLPGFTVFTVRDHGAGFDPALAQKLFVPFQRLHHAADFPGTGVGLATVKRIVKRHGGHVRADSRPGEGATFWIALPQTADAPASTREFR